MESSEIVFKTRKTKKNLRKRKQENQASDNEPEIAENISDILELRKLNQRVNGAQISTLPEPEDASKEVEKEREDLNPITKLSLQNFVQETSLEQTDKTNSKINEEEKSKKKKLKINFDQKYDILEEKETTQAKPKSNNGSDSPFSTSIVAGIEEVDLGIQSRLKNIEETEKAKRDLLLQKDQKSNTELQGIKTYHSKGNMNQPKVDYSTGSTDLQVMDQFKKRTSRH